ncbi:Phosphoadenosine phosphosulfate reductase [Streptomyces alboniger]
MTATQARETRTDDELRALAEQAGRDLEDASALEILTWAADTFGPRFCVTSSMEDAVVAHLASRAMPGVDVVFLDMGYHFPETIGTRHAVEVVLDVNVITLTPRQTVAEQDAEYGPRLHDRDPDLAASCARSSRLRRASPRTRPGRRDCAATQSPTRANTPVVGWDEKRRKVKASPIARWTQDDVDAYVNEQGVHQPPPMEIGHRLGGLRPLHPPPPGGRGGSPRSSPRTPVSWASRRSPPSRSPRWPVTMSSSRPRTWTGTAAPPSSNTWRRSRSATTWRPATPAFPCST